MAKKSFLNGAGANAAMQFISSAEPPELETAPAQEQPTSTATPAGFKADTQYIEKRTKRLQLVLQPSLYRKVSAAAKRRKVSVNEYIHNLLEEATKEK